MIDRITNPKFQGGEVTCLVQKDGITKKKIKVHNEIKKGFYAALYSLIVQSMFDYKMQTNGWLQQPKLFTQCSLRSDLKLAPEPLDELWLPGKELAFAKTTETYSGAATNQGTINENESRISLNKLHLVFDFPTHAANGEIKGIIFGGIDFKLPQTVTPIQGTDFNGFARTVDTQGNIYKSQYGIYKLDGANWTKILDNSNVKGISFYDGKIWAVENGNRILILNTNGQTEKEIPLVGIEDVNLITHKNGEIYATSSTEPKIIHVDKETGVKLSENSLANLFEDWNIRDMFFMENTLFLLDGSNIVIVDTVKKIKQSLNTSSTMLLRSGSNLLICDTTVKLALPSRIHSLCAFDNPIVKDNRHTLKIIYDIDFSPLVPFKMEI